MEGIAGSKKSAGMRDNNVRYLDTTHADCSWGLAVTTAGYQLIQPHSSYPERKGHPRSYFFCPEEGRRLSEYQLVYILEGNGFFESTSCLRCNVIPGTMILLFPGEWHTYAPDANGWTEYWVGFRGDLMDGWVTNGFFSRENPLYTVGVNAAIVALFEEIVARCSSKVSKDTAGYQQSLTGAVLHLLGELYFKGRRQTMESEPLRNMEKIDEACAIMRENIGEPVSMEEIARKLGVSYSWFRSEFKLLTGVSPAQYQLHLRYQRARELLADSRKTISEVAYALGFETVSQFSTFFSRRAGMSPSAFRSESAG